MNLAGKILVLLIMVMSICFMAFSVMNYVSHTNWHDLVERTKEEARQTGQRVGLRYEIQELWNLNQDLRDQRNRVQATATRERDDAAQRIAKLEQSTALMKEALAGLAAEKQRLAEENAQLVSTVKSTNMTLADKTTEVTDLRSALAKAHEVKLELMKNLVAETDKYGQAAAEAEILRTRTVSMGEQIAAMEKKFAHYKIPSHVLQIVQTPPDIQGEVTNANTEEGLVELSLDSDDGILAGHLLEVYRFGSNPQYLAQIRIVKSNKDGSVGKIIPETLRGTIERGDLVSPKVQRGLSMVR